MDGCTVDRDLPRAGERRGKAISFSQPFIFNKTQKPNKTVDIGRHGVSLSMDGCGRILQLSAFHSGHGIIVAAPFEQFDGTKFHDPMYVRAYRTRMLQHIQEDRGGFGLDFGFRGRPVSIQMLQSNVVLYRFQIDDSLSVQLNVRVRKDGRIAQTAQVDNLSSKPAVLSYALALNVSLNRASYGQLTEGGPIPLPRSHNILKRDDQGAILVRNPELGASMLVGLTVDGQVIDFPSIQGQETFDAPISAHASDELVVQPGAAVRLRATFRFFPTASQPKYPSLSASDDYEQAHSLKGCGWINQQAPTTYILRRNVDYILANCVIPITASTAAVITDHVALPLGWNRDNYWQIRLLFITYAHLNSLTDASVRSDYEEQIRFATKGHLDWVYNHAQRPKGYWNRSYLVTGEPKDRSIFQLDQQCYPLLELCDYLDTFPDEVDFVESLASGSVIHEVLALLDAKKDPETGLWPTDETPGDDAVVYPYHFSSQVLLWRTLTRLQNLFAKLRYPSNDAIQRLEATARSLKTNILQKFVVRHSASGNDIFAYLTDGHGAYTCYHDANDVPTFFALEWGLVATPSEIRIWENTMAFGLSSANKEGYCDDGLYGGLGSVHSPGAWVLGYFQELAYAAWKGDEYSMKAAWVKIANAMQWDGTFPEAVDPRTAECTSKAWFSWPGAMIGALIVSMRLNGQENILLGRKDVSQRGMI